MRMMSKPFILFSWLLVAFLTTPLLSSAQVIQHKVTPRVIDREVEARDIFTETITIENFANHKVDIYPTVNAVEMSAGGDVVDFAEPATADSSVTITNWIELSRRTIELMPGESTQIPLTIKISPNAAPGVYHAFLGFGTGLNRPEAQKQVEQGIAPGVVLTLSIAQHQTEHLKLDEFTVERFVVKNDNDAIRYTVTNTGEAPLTPYGEVVISNARGEEVATVPLQPQELASGQTSTFTTTVPTAGLAGKYRAFLSLDYGTEKIDSVYDSVYFYIVPLKLLALFFALFVASTGLIVFLLHRRYMDEDDGRDGHSVPMYVFEGKSKNQEHDINLKGS